jgi:hypothetical protein
LNFKTLIDDQQKLRNKNAKSKKKRQ